MECDKVRQLLGAYVDNELPPEDANRVKEHLKGCAECAREAAELSKVKQLVQSLPRQNAPAELSGKIRGQIAKCQKPQSMSAFWRYRWAIASLASAAVILILIYATTSKYSVREKTSALNSLLTANVVSPVREKASQLAKSGAVPGPAIACTQQIEITTADIAGAVNKINDVASGKVAGFDNEGEQKGSYVISLTEESPTNAPANEQTVQNNMASSLYANKIPSDSRVIRFAVPLKDKDIFIHNLRDYVSGQIVVFQMQSSGVCDALAQLNKEEKALEKNKMQKSREPAEGNLVAGGYTGELGKLETGKGGISRDESKDADKKMAQPPTAGMEPAPAPEAPALRTPPGKSATASKAPKAPGTPGAPTAQPDKPAGLREKELLKKTRAEEQYEEKQGAAQTQTADESNQNLISQSAQEEPMVEIIITINKAK